MYVRAEKVADAVLADLYLPEYEKMKLVKKMAYAPRYENWEKLGILPGGAKSEVCHGVVKCSTNLNSDPVDMLKDCLKLGISTGIYGLTLTNLLNDIVLGEPKLRLAPARSEGDRSGLYQYYDYRTSAFDVYISSGKAYRCGYYGKGKTGGSKRV